MMDLTLPLRLKGYRFPRAVRNVEALLAARGVAVNYETIRVWVDRFGPQIVTQIKRSRPPAGDKWHLDEMVITIGG